MRSKWNRSVLKAASAIVSDLRMPGRAERLTVAGGRLATGDPAAPELAASAAADAPDVAADLAGALDEPGAPPAAAAARAAGVVGVVGAAPARPALGGRLLAAAIFVRMRLVVIEPAAADPAGAGPAADPAASVPSATVTGPDVSAPVGAATAPSGVLRGPFGAWATSRLGKMARPSCRNLFSQ